MRLLFKDFLKDGFWALPLEPPFPHQLRNFPCHVLRNGLDQPRILGHDIRDRLSNSGIRGFVHQQLVNLSPLAGR